jgi:hypothetical protein
MLKKSILDTVVPVLNDWDKRPCLSKNPIQLAERVFELDTNVTRPKTKPQQDTGPAESGNFTRK